MATLDNRLTLTPKPKFAVCTISNSKLLSHTYNVNIMAVTYKNTRLGRSNKNSAVFAIIDKYSCTIGICYARLRNSQVQVVIVKVHNHKNCETSNPTALESNM